ncbi:MAG TPA: hypothetical protein VHE35_07455 [Kofleriaceae bacterium]|nr:hypothetical protein [Kofleriaceae bacterium]
MDAPVNVEQLLRWYLGHPAMATDLDRVRSGGPLALVGGPWDDLQGFAERLAPERAVLDLTLRIPSAREVTELFGEHPETIILARSGEQVFRALGVLVQPWYMLVSPLTARPNEAVPLLREAVAELGVGCSLDQLGARAVANLGRYQWRGLREIRDAARRFAALLDAGSVSSASRGLGVTRQALAKYVKQRTT